MAALSSISRSCLLLIKAAYDFAPLLFRPLYAAIDGQLATIIAVSDPIKPTIPQAIRALHELGLNMAMITGDNRRTAEAIAGKLAIDEVVAEVLPTARSPRSSGCVRDRVVRFVGDGINDAPALAQADVRLAVGTTPHKPIKRPVRRMASRR